MKKNVKKFYIFYSFLFLKKQFNYFHKKILILFLKNNILPLANSTDRQRNSIFLWVVRPAHECYQIESLVLSAYP